MSSKIDSREAWLVTVAALAMASVCFGAPLVVTVALKYVAADLGGYRSIPSAALSLGMFGTGIGGLAMGWLADRFGVRSVVMFGASMVCMGLMLSAGGQAWQLYVGHGLFIGLLGNGAIHAPLYVYVTRWFEARRGTALALIASGQYIAGATWPPVFERVTAAYGWQTCMAGFGILVVVVVLPLAVLFLRAAPEQPDSKPGATAAAGGGTVLDLRPNTAFALLAIASFLCCVPMAMPASHLIAFCGDVGLTAAKGAAMLSVLLVTAFVSRQLWGWLSDRVGGLMTLLVGSLAQVSGMTGFLLTQDEAGLFAVAAVFGLGLSGLVPAYILSIRQLFPAREASWRIPALLLTAMAGMATGSWSAGFIYDRAGYYAPAFATGIAANLLHLCIITTLVLQWRRMPDRPALGRAVA
ncbi:MAG: MFS transporter [Hyphomicrobiaceae bacterium]|nr:MFS transporter [Hyphomicrobiaceae bacterium]